MLSSATGVHGRTRRVRGELRGKNQRFFSQHGPSRQEPDRPFMQGIKTVAANECDVLIVGGGINGAGIARDAAGRDLKVILVEQSDLASSTSSASTKLIHGGLRYLETFEFRLVREALVERERLLAMAPHIIRPLQFVLPHVAGLRPRWQIRAGLFLYDHLGGRRRLPASRSVRLDSDFGAGLKAHLQHGFVYSDCWVDDSRLVLLNALDAADRGAQIRLRTSFLSAARTGAAWSVRVLDHQTRVRSEIRARALVNAAGPWVEQVLHQIEGIDTHAQVRLVKGSHIVVPRLYPGEHAYLLQHPDGRVVFTIPYQEHYTLIGTTDVSYEDDPANVSISADEVAYLCSTVNGYFDQPITPEQVRWSYAGVRPLSDDDESSASKVTRDYKLELDAPEGHAPLLSVFGGKITTYRRLAEAALAKLTPLIGGSKTLWTHRTPLPGGQMPRADFAAFAAGVRERWPFLPVELTQRLARAYGTRISEVLGGATSLSDLGRQFGAGLSAVEVEYLRREEWAQTADDIAWRRSKLGLQMQPQELAELAKYLQRD
jgi:glycerol-3-phosphate dehydrogenase